MVELDKTLIISYHLLGIICMGIGFVIADKQNKNPVQSENMKLYRWLLNDLPDYAHTHNELKTDNPIFTSFKRFLSNIYNIKDEITSIEFIDCYPRPINYFKATFYVYSNDYFKFRELLFNLLENIKLEGMNYFSDIGWIVFFLGTTLNLSTLSIEYDLHILLYFVVIIFYGVILLWYSKKLS